MDIFCGLFGKPDFKDVDDMPDGYKKIGTYGDETWYQKFCDMKTRIEERDSNAVYLVNTDTMKKIRDLIKKELEYRGKRIVSNTLLVGPYDETKDDLWVRPLIIETKHFIRINWIAFNR